MIDFLYQAFAQLWLAMPFVAVGLLLLVLHKLKKLKEAIMGQLEDLKAGEDQIDADVKALIDQDAKSFTDLEAAIAAGKTGPDLQPFIDQLKGTHNALAAGLVASQAADATTQPPAPPVPPAA